MYQLRCVVQNYHWGKQGAESVVAELKKEGDSTFEVKENEHYAEYWFGTHPSGPSEILVDGEFQLLKSFLEAHPEMLGNSQGREAVELPFLSKVLSVDTALSIQAHPDKKLAEILHETKPDLYKDDNHKPEMAYALGDFVAMCGFRDAEEIASHLKSYTYFRNLIGETISSQYEQAIAAGATGAAGKEALRKLFSAFLEANADNALEQINGMKEFLATKTDKTFTEQWVETLISQYPTDSGVFAPLLLNVLPLKAGDAIYLGADIPHAYLSGNIVETMACSNNVVRAGLTPKAIDKETLIDMLTYECGPVEVLHACNVDEHYATITTPAKEFMIEVMSVKKGETYTIPTLDVPRVLICYSGRGSAGQLEVKRGSILFQAASNKETICAEEDIVIYATHEKL